jgi:hypothetical protein
MPAFVLDMGSPEAAREFANLDTFTQGYIEAALWADGNAESLSAEGNGEGETDATFGDIAAQTLHQMKLDCQAFQAANAAHIEFGPGDASQAGHDFWLTRNGHGTGFWDRDDDVWSEPGRDAMDAYSRDAGEVSLYRGDDGLIYA